MEPGAARIRLLGLREYGECWEQMKTFTERRDAATTDEIWLLEHFPVYTQGLNGKIEHLLNPGGIPVIHSDRGGQATYHGPGQLVFYPLLDIRRRKLGVRQLVTLLERSAIETLKQYGIQSCARAEAPGVYVDSKKIASIGIRIRRGCSYHGMSLNVSMDLAPFDGIHICGFPSLRATRLADLGGPRDCHEVAIPLAHQFLNLLEEGVE
ncbi:MAG: lipoyl(octanoyl) transferase LipB [Gammaproteobacteria bacterium]